MKITSQQIRIAKELIGNKINEMRDKENAENAKKVSTLFTKELKQINDLTLSFNRLARPLYKKLEAKAKKANACIEGDYHTRSTIEETKKKNLIISINQNDNYTNSPRIQKAYDAMNNYINGLILGTELITDINKVIAQISKL